MTKDGDVAVSVSFSVTNTGTVAGAEVAQVYTSLPTSSLLSHPPSQLKGFKKVFLQPGESATVEITLDKYAVSYWEQRIKRWVVEDGVYRVRVGTSSAPEALKLSGEFKVPKYFEWSGL